jgi:hypothetical protein
MTAIKKAADEPKCWNIYASAIDHKVGWISSVEVEPGPGDERGISWRASF